jgi:hypothetical protein
MWIYQSDGDRSGYGMLDHHRSGYGMLDHHRTFGKWLLFSLSKE